MATTKSKSRPTNRVKPANGTPKKTTKPTAESVGDEVLGQLGKLAKMNGGRNVLLRLIKAGAALTETYVYHDTSILRDRLVVARESMLDAIEILSDDAPSHEQMAYCAATLGALQTAIREAGGIHERCEAFRFVGAQ